MKADTLFKSLGYKLCDYSYGGDGVFHYVKEDPSINTSISIVKYSDSNSVGITKCVYFGDWCGNSSTRVPFNSTEIKAVYLKLKEEGYCD